MISPDEQDVLESLKITYDISYEEFAALQPGIPPRPARALWYRLALVLSIAFGATGVLRLLDEPWSASGGVTSSIEITLALITLGAAVAVLTQWFWNRRQRHAARAHSEQLIRSYQQLHCRDERVVEVSESGFKLCCRCGVVARPWRELVSFSENDFMMNLATKSESILISKRGFAAAGEITEFRALVLDQLDQQRKSMAAYIDFSYQRQDFTYAQWLHILHGGGWKPLARRAALLSAICYFVMPAAFFTGSSRQYSLLPAYTLPALFVLWAAYFIACLLAKARRAKHYFGPLRAWFTGDAMWLRDVAAESRIPWESYIGYLEDSRLYLLYHNPRLYRIVPKRIFDQRRERVFRDLMTSKLRRVEKSAAVFR